MDETISAYMDIATSLFYGCYEKSFFDVFRKNQESSDCEKNFEHPAMRVVKVFRQFFHVG